MNGSARRVDVDVGAVAGNREAVCDPVLGEHHLVHVSRDQLYHRIAGKRQTRSGEPVFDAVFGVRVVTIGLDLIARGQVAPAAGNRAEHARARPIVLGVGQRGGDRRQPEGRGVGQRCRQLGHAVRVEKPGVGGAVEERRMTQHVDQELTVGAQTVQPGAYQRIGQHKRIRRRVAP